MKASMYEGNHSFGLHDYEPKAPGAHEVQVDVAYCGICGSDLHVFHGDYDYRFSTLPHRPRVLRRGGCCGRGGDRLEDGGPGGGVPAGLLRQLRSL